MSRAFTRVASAFIVGALVVCTSHDKSPYIEYLSD
ncbi:uncharacterized protein METZ01_LOCUS352626, partial [marine metagenome]